MAASWATTNPAGAFPWSGRGAAAIRGAWSAEPCIQSAEEAREVWGLRTQRTQPCSRSPGPQVPRSPGPQVPAPGLGIRALMTESAACPVLWWGKKNLSEKEKLPPPRGAPLSLSTCPRGSPDAVSLAVCPVGELHSGFLVYRLSPRLLLELATVSGSRCSVFGVVGLCLQYP